MTSIIKNLSPCLVKKSLSGSLRLSCAPAAACVDYRDFAIVILRILRLYAHALRHTRPFLIVACNRKLAVAVDHCHLELVLAPVSPLWRPYWIARAPFSAQVAFYRSSLALNRPFYKVDEFLVALQGLVAVCSTVDGKFVGELDVSCF